MSADNFGTSAILFWHVGRSVCNFGAAVLALQRIGFATSVRLSYSLPSSCSKHLGGTVLRLRRASFHTSGRRWLHFGAVVLTCRHVGFGTSAGILVWHVGRTLVACWRRKKFWHVGGIHDMSARGVPLPKDPEKLVSCRASIGRHINSGIFSIDVCYLLDVVCFCLCCILQNVLGFLFRNPQF